jgi:site-specific recombinase XerD
MCPMQRRTETLLSTPDSLFQHLDLDARSVLLEPGLDVNVVSRLKRYIEWLEATGNKWYLPTLAPYRDYLLERGSREGTPLEAATVQSHLASIRGRYRQLLRDRDLFYSMTSPDVDVLYRKLVVDEITLRIQLAIEGAAARVVVEKKQDREDLLTHRLSKAEAEALLSAPGTDTLNGLRDTAIFATMLCTGIRDQELRNLDVSDLYHTLGGKPALKVFQGKGKKTRLVPYGEMQWFLPIVEHWLYRAEITEGVVFRKFWPHSTVGDSLTASGLFYIFSTYPIEVLGRLQPVRPHDLRRAYAYNLWKMGVPIEAIQQNLGHANLATTMDYIGQLDADIRAPKATPYVLQFTPPMRLEQFLSDGREHLRQWITDMLHEVTNPSWGYQIPQTGDFNRASEW